MGWAENVARIRDMRNSYKMLVATPEGKEQFEDHDIDGKIIALEWILENLDGKVCTRDQWGGFLNTVTNLRVRQRAQNFLTS
jgi:hypothetical protein